MSEVVVSAVSGSVPPSLPEFLRVQKSGYLQAVGQGGARNNRWTISLGNEAGGMPSMGHYS